jgi:hypothetical protein
MGQLITLEYVRTFNWEGALRGMRNPLESWDKSDTMIEWEAYSGGDYKQYCIEIPSLGPNDYDLAMRLIRAGSDHRKFLRQIFISFDLSCAWGIWKEYATYKVGTVENSTSQMHKLGSRTLTQDDFAIENWEPIHTKMLEQINGTILSWQNLRDTPEATSETIKEAWRTMLSIIPGSFIYKRTCTMNYEVLRAVYAARKNHKQKEWHIFLDEILKAIPYSEFITEK